MTCNKSPFRYCMTSTIVGAGGSTKAPYLGIKYPSVLNFPGIHKSFS